MSSEWDVLTGAPVMAILRNMSVAKTLDLAHQAWDLGITLVEVPIQTPEAVSVFESVVNAGQERGMLVGSGTVTSEDQVVLSKRLGAAFTVAPGLDHDVVRASARLGIPHLPGVATATDIQAALSLGCTWLKAFPASVLGPEWFKAMKQGPFPEISLVATGGIDASNAQDYLATGASTVAVGSALADPRQVDLLGSLLNM